MKSAIKKIKDPYLNLMHYNKSYYLVDYCEYDIIKLLTLRNPKYIIIDENNNYDTVLIDKIPKIEYLTNLINYGLYIDKLDDNILKYDNKYQYELYAYSENGIYVYKNIDKDKNKVVKNPTLISKKSFKEKIVRIENKKQAKCAKKLLKIDLKRLPNNP
jgi:hypothetical protein